MMAASTLLPTPPATAVLKIMFMTRQIMFLFITPNTD